MEERIKKLQNKLSANQVKQKPKDEDAGKILKWSKNFIVPSLQKLYSKKLVNKENFKDLAKYLSLFCASNREMSDGLKTGKFLKKYVDYYISKNARMDELSSEDLKQL